MSARRLIAVAAAALLCATPSHVTRAQSRPFTPQVEEFVDVYLKNGGDKLTTWVQGQTAPPPDRTLRAFKPLAGLTMELVAAEPVIRQPVDLHFDDRGRLWVVQYLQYPFPAGLTITAYDQYLRARYDRVPAPPPNHVRGADKITVLEDKDGDGSFESHHDVITGLNITTSVLTGHGGVWVMNPPYLLFYRDTTGDGLPDGEPEVRLAGFGLEDTHSLANSLTWGPDGWLYGVHGSTSTARVRDVSFLGQAVWRYHPDTDDFELFAQGGGNPWTLSFDSKGRAFSGDNGGNSRGFHWVTGGRYDKNWPKHGPFNRPYSYGSIPNMDHEGYAARFAMTSVIYEDGRLPGYEGQLISGMALTSRIQATRLVGDGSTFRTVDTDALVTTDDRSFRPVDMAVGPDGAIYVADWCDIRMDHTDPRDTWDKSCGRIWRLRAKDWRPAPRFDLSARSSGELVQLLDDPRKWYRDHARRLLGERRDRSVLPELRRLARESRGQLALEALWTAYQIAGMDQEWALPLMSHGDAPVRLWAVRLLPPSAPILPALRETRRARANRAGPRGQERAGAHGGSRRARAGTRDAAGIDTPPGRPPRQARAAADLVDARGTDRARRGFGAELAGGGRALAGAAVQRASGGTHRAAAGSGPRRDAGLHAHRSRRQLEGVCRASSRPDAWRQGRLHRLAVERHAADQRPQPHARCAVAGDGARGPARSAAGRSQRGARRGHPFARIPDRLTAMIGPWRVQVEMSRRSRTRVNEAGRRSRHTALPAISPMAVAWSGSPHRCEDHPWCSGGRTC